MMWRMPGRTGTPEIQGALAPRFYESCQIDIQRDAYERTEAYHSLRMEETTTI
jgi:hypothetical protein